VPIILFRNKPLPKRFNFREPLVNYCSPDDEDDDMPNGSTSPNAGSPWASPTSRRLRKLTKMAASHKSANFAAFSAEEVAARI
jgi:hypothetical protein